MIGLIPLLFAFSFDVLKYSEMSCPDAQTLIDRVYEYNQKSEFITKEDADEIVGVIKESVPRCFNEGSESNP
jgi:hypothetical protein